jgi:hypothetical protein
MNYKEQFDNEIGIKEIKQMDNVEYYGSFSSWLIKKLEAALKTVEGQKPPH